MTPEHFCYWMQGFAELTQRAPTDSEWASIKDHLKLVFKKVTPETTIKDKYRDAKPMPYVPKELPTPFLPLQKPGFEDFVC